jgi:hypothetical protein
MADLYLTPAERYTAALGGFYYGDLPEPGTVYTQLIKDILNGTTPEKEPKNILARFIYSLYISDLGDPYPRYELAKLLYWKLHDITPIKSGSILTVTIDGKEDYMTINTDLSRLWYKVLFGSKTDVITEFPYIFNTMQNKLSDWELFGNVEVSGTPTPDSPAMPEGTGDMSGNLFDVDARDTNNGYVNNMQLNQDGTMTSWTTSEITEYIELTPNATYTLTNIGSYNYLAYCIYDNDRQYITGNMYRGQATKVINMPPNGKYLRFTHVKTKPNTMLNLGSTPLPYEPYGYKIPISCGGTTTPVYLGEVQTTRAVKKLVLTGEEDWENSINPTLFGVIRLLDLEPFIPQVTAYCSHYIYNPIQSGLAANMVNGEFALQKSSNAFNLYIRNTDYTRYSNFKDYLAQQYAAGTPVTVWYVLANEETVIVNEPLMKIGEYADSLSRAQTGIDIPTVIGQNTIDVLTTVKPSSMRIEYTSADETRSRSKRISLLKSPLKKGLIK